jgi:hypothetical protein
MTLSTRSLVGSPEDCVSFKLSNKYERESYDRSGACTEAQKTDVMWALRFVKGQSSDADPPNPRTH